MEPNRRRGNEQLSRAASNQLPVEQQQQRVDAPNQCDSHDEEGRSELEQLRLERRDEHLPTWGSDGMGWFATSLTSSDAQPEDLPE